MSSAERQCRMSSCTAREVIPQVVLADKVLACRCSGLRRPGRPFPEARDYPFTEPIVMPATMYLWLRT